jgi:hypothetical protein
MFRPGDCGIPCALIFSGSDSDVCGAFARPRAI